MTRINIIFSGLLVVALASGCLPDDEDGQGTRPALPELNITGVEVEEGSDGVRDVTLTVSVTGLNLSNAVVDYRTENGTAPYHTSSWPPVAKAAPCCRSTRRPISFVLAWKT